MKENYMLALSGPASEPGLELLWSFDVALGTPCEFNGLPRTCESDLSGNGNDGLLGALPTVENQLSYLTGQTSTSPIAPEIMPSTAPLIGGGKIVAMLSPTGHATIELKSHDGDGDDLTTIVTNAPSMGILSLIDSGTVIGSGDAVVDASRTASKRIMYSVGSEALSGPGDNFTYSVFDGADYAFGA